VSVNLEASEYAALRDGFDRVAEKSASLPSRAYRDPRFLLLDQTEIFFRSWQFLCHSENLRRAGSYVTGIIQGRSIFAVRDSNSQLRAFYNVCRHRGHELLKGTGNARTIICPYHAWSYGLDGALSVAPGSKCLEHFNKGDFGLKPIQVEEFCGLVFVNLELHSPSLAATSGDLAAEIKSYAPDLERLTFAHRLTYTVQANWKVLLDNFLECRHCPVAHKDFCTLVDMDTYEVQTHGIYSSHIAKAGRTDNRAYAVAGATVTDHAVWYLWPNTTLLRYPGRANFMVWQFTPIGPEATHEEFNFYFESGTPTADELEAIRYIDSVLQREDIDLVESVQRGMRTPAFDRGRYLIDRERTGLSEHAVHHFHSLVLDAYSRAVRP
jgi:carnitine monooxygenase subunit